ncbi:acyl-CoA/acyl-ACP dehydrogenase [Mycobacterium sp. CVI_P3]|uniref:Acyl-CoA/acyl-ACP dehydrogenase n=1 Tax=Mycobacterium pinniadriaticum TaxID=2994102 RepID=A0ABT3SP38_9MYCO|nr:acyl-CoA dehydrogenase family protein [Mycobacterium pinniadriaticum]MCX2934864.1 acyl-CoA/acyl-ACP dehydrogenase [Mycobacterium pinniadriaticum]MCX2941295.1 acyl-CoA/acyl-ACP dehydrogenase [Mycobacterium pinniadriaticum]
MKLVAGQDERDLASSLRGLLSAGRADLWSDLAAAGVMGLGLPECHGGSGGTLADLGIFAREAGRALCPMRVHSTAIAAHALHILGGEKAVARWLPDLAAGRIAGTTALWNPTDASDVTATMRADQTKDGSWRLTGTADFVADADTAEIIVVTGFDKSGNTVVFVVRLGNDGVTLRPLALMGGHRASVVRFDDVEVDDVLGDGASPDRDELRRVANAAVVLTSLDLVGVGEAVMDRTVRYTSMRHQFGRPIASFQAAQHVVADMHIALAAARLAAQSAVHGIAKGRAAIRETAIARIQSATAAKWATLDAHQLHGGMGYVVETDLYLWSERARVLSTLGGGSDIAAAWLDDDEVSRAAVGDRLRRKDGR